MKKTKKTMTDPYIVRDLALLEEGVCPTCMTTRDSFMDFRKRDTFCPKCKTRFISEGKIVPEKN
jgi:tRNA(Ile2) C34 agmatinyltransferase TiaS